MTDYEETENSRVREIFQWFPYPIWPRQIVSFFSFNSYQLIFSLILSKNIQMQKCIDGNQSPWILQKSVFSEKYPLKPEHVRSTWSIGAYRFIDIGISFNLKIKFIFIIGYVLFFYSFSIL